MSYLLDIICPACGKTYTADEPHNICSCGSPLLARYDMEQAKGHGAHNILTVLMKEKAVDLQTASDVAGEMFAELVAQFNADKAKLPVWGRSIDDQVAAYVEGLEHWVAGNLAWSFETPRYFGIRHNEVRNTMVVTLHSPDMACTTCDPVDSD